jgi:hypothetical protein
MTTPIRVDRLAADDALLDALGGRRYAGDDPVALLLGSFATACDAPIGCVTRPGARRRRVLWSTFATGLFLVSGISVSAAVSANLPTADEAVARGARASAPRLDEGQTSFSAPSAALVESRVSKTWQSATASVHAPGVQRADPALLPANLRGRTPVVTPATRPGANANVNDQAAGHGGASSPAAAGNASATRGANSGASSAAAAAANANASRGANSGASSAAAAANASPGASAKTAGNGASPNVATLGQAGGIPSEAPTANSAKPAEPASSANPAKPGQCASAGRAPAGR